MRAIKDLIQLSQDDLFKQVAKGMKLIVENANKLAKHAQILGKDKKMAWSPNHQLFCRRGISKVFDTSGRCAMSSKHQRTERAFESPSGCILRSSRKRYIRGV